MCTRKTVPWCQQKSLPGIPEEMEWRYNYRNQNPYLHFIIENIPYLKWLKMCNKKRCYSMKIIVITSIVILSFFALQTVSYAQLSIGEQAPEFTLNTIDNDPVSLNDFTGKAVLIIFFGYNCPYCKASAPFVESLIWQRHGGPNFTVLGVDQWGGSSNQIRTVFKNPTEVTYPLLESGRAVAAQYKVTYDWFVLLDQEHKIYYTASGTLRGGDAQKIVSDLESKVVELITTTSVEGAHSNSLPTDFELKQNFPNPFNPNTTIQFQLPAASHMSLKIYNLDGQLIKTLISEQMTAGNHNVNWDGTNDLGIKVGSGLYFYRIQAGRFTTARRMILIK